MRSPDLPESSRMGGRSVPDFVFSGGWFDCRYRNLSDGRYATFKLALNLMLQRSGTMFVETGCVRQENDFGAGYSTFMFSDFLSRYGGLLLSVDISETNVRLAERLTQDFPVRPILTNDDSIHFLKSTLRQHPMFTGKIDLLYLDSFDYPLDRLHAACPPPELNEMSDDDIALRFPELVLPPQQHCLAELQAASDLLHAGSVVLIDDNNLPGGGKSRLAKQTLLDWGWICLLDFQQTVWIPGKSFAGEWPV